MANTTLFKISSLALLSLAFFTNTSCSKDITIKFDPVDGVLEDIDSNKITIKSGTPWREVLTRPTASRSGYYFTYWALETDASSGLDNSYVFTKNTTLYANYNAKATYYTIQFVDNFGGETNLLQSSKVKEGSIPVYRGKIPVHPYFEFAGWTPSITAASKNCTYTAVYLSR